MSFSTYDVKTQWRTVFCCGNTENPEEVILILGSCRAVPFLNYLHHYNQTHGNRFKIYCIDPLNYCIDMAGNHLDQKKLLKDLETDKHFLDILKSVTIFIHEGLSSFGILNTVIEADADLESVSLDNIYGHGMQPEIDVNICNFHDVALLFNDFKAMGHPSDTECEQRAIVLLGDKNIDRFCRICDVSSFPEFGPWFREHFLTTRLFHSFNHVSAAFTREIFRLANEKFLHLDLDDAFWQHPDVLADMYSNVSTKLTDLDRRWRNYTWSD